MNREIMEIFKQHSSKLEEDTITLPAGPSGMAMQKPVMDKKIHSGDMCLFQEIHIGKVMFSCIHYLKQSNPYYLQ